MSLKLKVGDRFKDRVREYVVLETRQNRGRRTHMNSSPVDVLVQTNDQNGDRWVWFSAIKDMYDDGQIELIEDTAK